jgi:Family of unknown function (DUF5675)
VKVEIRRKWETARSVCGEMWVDGQFEAFTLEPARVNPVHPGHPAIPAGSYRVILTPSPHLGYVTPEVLEVPGRSHIRWHIGNKPEDVEGCVAVGHEHSTDYVSHSGAAFSQLMTLLREANDEIVAEYSDPPAPAADVDGEISV